MATSEAVIVGVNSSDACDGSVGRDDCPEPAMDSTTDQPSVKTIFKVPMLAGLRPTKPFKLPLPKLPIQSVNCDAGPTVSPIGLLQCDEEMEDKKAPNKQLPEDGEQSITQTSQVSMESGSVKPEQLKTPMGPLRPSGLPVFEKIAHDKSSPPPLPYKEPLWSGIPKEPYVLEVLKGGQIVDRVDLSGRAFTVFGRLSGCDVTLEHPSISRYHAIVQHRVTSDGDHPAGLYLYDLGSTHGSCLNKSLVKAHCYYRLRVGHMVKFGGSSRMFILQGPEEDAEPESELTVTELKERRRNEEERLRKLEEAEIAKEKEEEERRQAKEESEGVNWGMGEDATEEDDLEHNPFALEAPTINEDIYLDDPKKTLRGWFEREGYELEYEIEEKGTAHFLCKVQLPLDTPSGNRFYAEASVKGKKKEAVVACALEACRILDRRGLLRQATHESRERKLKNWEEDDFYDSDEDTYLDQTGTIERKRLQRIQKSGKGSSSVETYDSLMEKHAAVLTEIQKIEATLTANEQQAARAAAKDADDEDELDAYMASIQSAKIAVDKKTKTRLKLHLLQLKQEESKFRRLVNIAKPATLPPLQPITSDFNSSIKSEPKSKISARVMPENSTAVTASTMLKVTSEKIDKVLPVKSKLKGAALPPKLFADRAAQLTSQDDSKTNMGINESIPDTMPPAGMEKYMEGSNAGIIEENNLTEEDQRALSKRKDTRDRKAIKRAKEKEKYVYDNSDPNYAMWLPPEDQAGDGKTSLNDKFGY